ncbi:hypothetical protein ACFRCW_18630 [Streptomyces sp. NPDC056653]|uniref:hypothetical protein n=1 Tax=Streptomyces sp. NPDC056653 TaxID=3345894 RepID=UPI003690E5AB
MAGAGDIGHCAGVEHLVDQQGVVIRGPTRHAGFVDDVVPSDGEIEISHAAAPLR